MQEKPMQQEEVKTKPPTERGGVIFIISDQSNDFV